MNGSEQSKISVTGNLAYTEKLQIMEHNLSNDFKAYPVSVIIPLYKVEELIERCARSLFNQSLSDVEYIFIDDCGGDRSVEIIKEILADYPHRQRDVHFLHNEYNVGAATSRNRGLDNVHGEYIAFCDGDDWLEEDALERMYYFATSGSYDLIWTDFYFSEPNRDLASKQLVKADADSCIRALLTEGMHGALWNKMYKRSLFEESKVRFIDGADLWEDLCINIRLFYQASKLGYLQEAFYHYEQTTVNSITRLLNGKTLTNLQTNISEITDFLQKKTGDRFARELLILKLAAKQNLLFRSDVASFKEWRQIYPESNSYIMQFTTLPIHLRILGWCSWRRWWPLIEFWLILKQFKNKRK